MAKIEILNEPTHTFGSADNPRQYSLELDLSGGYRPSSVHGVLVDDNPVLIIGASGGATGIHGNSLLKVGDRAYVAVGPYVVSFTPSPFQYHWALEVDSATCFGIHFHKRTETLLSHGELEIARFSPSGEIIWSESGADIFSEAFTLHDDFVEATDFNGDVYRFKYVDGHQFAKQIIPGDALGLRYRRWFLRCCLTLLASAFWGALFSYPIGWYLGILGGPKMFMVWLPVAFFIGVFFWPLSLKVVERHYE